MPGEARWQEQCLEALKAIGKALGQMSLYRVGHPEVAQTLRVAFAALEAAGREMGQGGGEISFSLNQGKIIANGRNIGSAAKLPTAVPGFFERLKVGSLTFKPGLRMAELEAFCELSALRRDALAGQSSRDFLSQKGVEHIVLEDAVYAQVNARTGIFGSPGLGAAAGEAANAETAAPAPAGSAVDLAPRLAKEKTLDGALQALIAQAVPELEQRDQVRQAVARLLEQDIQRRVEETVRPLREAKTRLENEQARTEGVLHQTVDGVIVVDEQGKILMMNPVAEQIWGSPLSQAAGLALAEKVGENHVVTLAAELTAPSNRAIDAHAKVAAPPELRRSVQSAGAVVQTEEGKIVGMVAGPTDAAKYREAERAQREFVAHVTHELRSPLSSIRAALELLQGEAAPKLGAEHGKMLETALKNSDRLANLISGILDFSKIEAGQMEVYPKKEDAASIAREAAESMAPWAQKKGLRLTYEASAELPALWADRSRAIQVLVNLISNAIKFTPSAGSVALRAEVDPGDPRFVRFSVADTGPGIAKAQQGRVFEKFVQIAAGESSLGGTGLGLSIAKALVHLQKGRMWLESDEGKGAAFFFTLPAYASQEIAAPRESATPRPWWKRLLGI